MLEERKGIVNELAEKTPVWVLYAIMAAVDALCLWGIFNLLKGLVDHIFHLITVA